MTHIYEIVFDLIDNLKKKAVKKTPNEKDGSFFSHGYFAFLNANGDYIGYADIDSFDTVAVSNGIQLDLNDTRGPYFYFRLRGPVQYRKSDGTTCSRTVLKRTIPLKLVYYVPKGNRFSIELFTHSFFSGGFGTYNGEVYNFVSEPYEVYVEEILYGKKNDVKIRQLGNTALVSFDIDITDTVSSTDDCSITICSQC